MNNRRTYIEKIEWWSVSVVVGGLSVMVFSRAEFVCFWYCSSTVSMVSKWWRRVLRVVPAMWTSVENPRYVSRSFPLLSCMWCYNTLMCHQKAWLESISTKRFRQSQLLLRFVVIIKKWLLKYCFSQIKLYLLGAFLLVSLFEFALKIFVAFLNSDFKFAWCFLSWKQFTTSNCSHHNLICASIYTIIIIINNNSYKALFFNQS